MTEDPKADAAGVAPDKTTATSGSGTKNPLLTNEQEAFLLPVLNAAYASAQSERGEAKFIGKVGCGWLVLAAVVGRVAARTGAGAILLGLAIAAIGVGAALFMQKRRASSRREGVIEGLTTMVGLPREQMAQLFPLCVELEMAVGACHDATLELLKKGWGMNFASQVTGGTKFGEPPVGFVSRYHLLGLAQLIGTVAKPSGFDEGVATGTLRGNAKNGLKKAEAIAELMRQIRP